MRLVASAVVTALVLATSIAKAQVTRGVTWGPGAQAVGGDSQMPSLSADGRWVAFESAAGTLAADDLNGVRDVFLADRASGAVQLISRGPSGVGNAASYAAAVSGNGAVVAFVSEASNLVIGAPGPGLYVFDRATSQVSRVPLAAGVRVDTRAGLRRVLGLSADGRILAFGAYSESRGAYPFAILLDRSQGTLTTLSNGRNPRVNAAGTLLAFENHGSSRAMRVLDLTNGAVADVTPAPGADCGFPSLSNDGRWVAYECRSVPDALPLDGARTRVYLHDRLTNTPVEISTPLPGATRRHSLAADISADGRFVAFTSFSRLVSEVADDTGHVYRYDRNTGVRELLSKDVTGTPLPGSFGAAMDATGSVVALSTDEAVDVSDTNGRDDVYLVDPACQYAVSPSSAAFPPGGGQITIAVTTGGGCLWRTESGTTPFFSVNAPRGGSGSGSATLAAAANTVGVSRVATLSVAGRTVTVSQSPAVGPVITTHPSDAIVASGSTAMFGVSATGDPAPTFRWQISNDGATWFFVGESAPYSGTTSAQLTVTNVPAAPFWNRFRAVATNLAGTATSNAARLTVTSCAYSSAPVDATLPAGGGSGYVDLATAATCAWTTSSSAGWLTVEPAAGVGSARITYAAGANTTGSPRATQIFIAGRSGVVRQGSVAGTLTITTTALPPATVGLAYSGLSRRAAGPARSLGL